MCTMNEMKNRIITAFKKIYGFGPCKKDIIPMESSGSGNLLDWMAFTINGIGYTYNVVSGLTKSDIYNI